MTVLLIQASEGAGIPDFSILNTLFIEKQSHDFHDFFFFLQLLA